MLWRFVYVYQLKVYSYLGISQSVYALLPSNEMFHFALGSSFKSMFFFFDKAYYKIYLDGYSSDTSA